MSLPVELVPKELAVRWGVDMRTVRRRRKILRMREKRFTGSVPVYTLEEVRRAERAWNRHMRHVLAEQSKRASRPRGTRKGGVLSMDEIRKRAADA